MIILHLSSEATWRGGEQQIAYLIDELQQKDIFNLVACRKGSAFEAYCQKQPIKHFSLSFNGSFDLSTALAIRNICRKERITLVHIHSAKSHSLAVLAHVLGNRVPLILSRRVDFPVRSNTLTQWKYNHPAVKRIICVSKTIEKIVRSSIKRPDRCATVHSGIDISRIKASPGLLKAWYQLPDETLLVGNTSALAGHKDYFTFIRAAALFKQYDISARFFMIGDGPEKEELQAYIEEKDLTDYVIMTGFLDNIHAVLPELDIFLMTSQTEGLGTSVLDAFAARVPVVSTRAGGIPEMVIHKKTGLLAEIKDAQQLASHLKRLVEQPKFREVLADNAYQHLKTCFTKEKMAEGTLRIYQEVPGVEDR
jgi:L-malate glycosyltransferase